MNLYLYLIANKAYLNLLLLDTEKAANTVNVQTSSDLFWEVKLCT